MSAFWEIKDCQGQSTPPTALDIHFANKVIWATLSQLVQQAQFIFETFLEQQTITSIIGIGLLFNYYIFKWSSTLQLSSNGNKLKLLSIYKAKDILTKIEHRAFTLFNKKRTDYSKIFKNC